MILCVATGNRLVSRPSTSQSDDVSVAGPRGAGPVDRADSGYANWSEWVMSGKHLGHVERDEVWVQHAIEHYRHAQGQFPHKLSVAVTSRPNAMAAIERLGWENVDYQIHPTRGYLLTFVRRKNHSSDGNGSEEVEVRVQDHHSFLSNLRMYQQQSSDNLSFGPVPEEEDGEPTNKPPQHSRR
jgi:hypothetical protein